MSVDDCFDVPVLFLVFNRLDTTMRVLSQIKKVKPAKLYLASDGARNEAEKAVVQNVRDCILREIDWNCEINTLFRKDNLGCKYAVSEAITWFFDKEEFGIVLEDDCLPSLSFFYYCRELLNKYRYDNRIFLISGYNKQNTWSKSDSSYFYSSLGGIWGWASWRRAWNEFDIDMKKLPQFIEENNFVHLLGSKVGKIRQKHIISANRDSISAWDYQWGFARHCNSGLACVPSVSLVKNIGFGAGGTHTSFTSDDGVVLQELNFPLKHNELVVPDSDYDYLFIKSRSVWLKAKDFIIRNLRKKK